MHGKICYIILPAADIQASAEFYREVFGWRIRTRSDGSVAFDDCAGAVSGAWTTKRVPMQHAPEKNGPMTYIMVDDAEQTITKIPLLGGAIVQPIGADAPEITALFRDPGGNILGIYQNPIASPLKV
jgi:hypothetical protein